MEKWKIPPILKVYEALGAIGDQRVFVDGSKAEVISSDGNKKYDVVYSATENAIMANDNGSYWVGYLGYPSIAYLMQKGILKYNSLYGEALRGIEWKKLNAKNKNDYDLTQKEADKILLKNEVNLNEFYIYLAEVMSKITNLNLNYLGKKIYLPK